MTTLGAAVTELATLLPALACAIGRDTGQGTISSAFTPGSVVNQAVFHAILTLEREIPQTYHHARGLVSESPTNPSRTVGSCLLALPRFGDRMITLGKVQDARELEVTVAGWVRLSKRALGFIAPSWHLPPEWVCPDHDTPRTRLRHVGAEEAVRWVREGKREGWKREQVRNPYIFCPHCGAVWPWEQWDLLERVVNERHLRETA